MKYPVVLHTDDGENYGVIIPDVKGCFSAGEGVEEALSNAQEAIENHFEILAEDNDPIPEPSRIQDHTSNPDYHGGVWASLM